MQQDVLRNQYIQYLNNVCKDETLRVHALSFFDDLGEFYSGVDFTRDDFSKMLINGVYVEQDVCKALFADATTRSAQEIFFYLITNNVSTIGFKEPKVVMEEYNTGYYNPTSKEVGIVKKTPQDIGATNNHEQVSFAQPAYNNSVNILIDDIYKSAVYHELGHIFETVTFCDRQYVKVGTTQKFLVNGSEGWLRLEADYVDRTSYIRAYNQTFCMPQAQAIFLNLKRKGALSLAETINQVFSAKLNDEFAIEPRDNTSFMFVCKKELVGNCSYNTNYDVYSWLSLAVPELLDKKSRFNYAQIIKKINALPISQTTLQQLPTYDSKKTIYDNFCANLGMCESSMDKATRELAKMSVKTAILEAVTHQMVTSMYDPSVTKDKEYFASINHALRQIDDFIEYPKKRIAFNNLGLTIAATDILSVGELARIGDHKSLYLYANLIANVRNCVEQSDIVDLYPTMTVLVEQDECKDRLELLASTDKEAALTKAKTSPSQTTQLKTATKPKEQ